MVNEKDESLINSNNDICPECREPINSSAKVCHHCHSKICWRSRFSISSLITSLAMLATVGATIMLVCSYQKTIEGLKIQEVSLSQIDSSLAFSHRQNELQEKALGKIDSSLALTVEQLKIQRRANELTDSSISHEKVMAIEEREKYIDENEPDISIVGSSCFLLGDSIKVVINIKNDGIAIADSIELTALVFNLHDKSLNRNFRGRIENIPGGKRSPNIYIIDKASEFVMIFKVKWKWELYGKDYETTLYRYGKISNSDNDCNIIAIVEDYAMQLLK